jgi:hypothetical protein
MDGHTWAPDLASSPITRLGQVSVMIFGAALLCFGLSIVAGPRGSAFFDEPGWAVLTILWVTGALAAFATSLYAIFRRGERSIVTFAIVAMLAVPVGWIVFELTVPHSN